MSKLFCCPKCGESDRLGVLCTVLARIYATGPREATWEGETDLDTQEIVKSKSGRTKIVCFSCDHEWFSTVEIS